MSAEAKKQIREHAWSSFPAQELWIDEKDNFWAFEKGVGEIYSTTGNYINDKLSYKTEVLKTDMVDSTIEEMVAEKENDGFSCFAIELAV